MSMGNNVFSLKTFGFQGFSKKRFVYAEGIYLYDDEGERYLDFHTGNGVAFLGHRNKYVVDKLKNQLDKIMVLGSSYSCEIRDEALGLLKTISPRELTYIAFLNSGSEAVEFALKIFFRKNTDGKILAFKNAFHGRTLGALSVTGNHLYRKHFPTLENTVFLPYNDIEALEQMDFSEIQGIILEVIQGEGGVNPGSKEFFRYIQKVVDENDLLLIVDEIQTGFGRTGSTWAYSDTGLKPDILLAGKSIGGGFPVSIVFAREDLGGVLQAWEHGSTFGGNPMAMAAVSGAIQAFHNDNVVERALVKGKLFFKRIEEDLVDKGLVREVKGKGLMIGLKTRLKSEKILSCLLEKGILALKAGVNVVRLLPPYIINEEDIGLFVKSFRACME